MSSLASNALKLLRTRTSSRSHSLRSLKTAQRRSFVHSASNRYAQEATVSAAYGGRVQSPFWAPLVAAPFAYAAFWGSSDNENTLEKANEDIEELALHLRTPDEESAALASKVIAKIMALPANQIRRDTMYVLAAVSTAAKLLAEVNPDSPEAQDAVMQSYALAKRIASDSKQPDELKLDALRCAHKAEYFVFVYRNDYQGMRAVLEKDLKAVREHYHVKKQIEKMSFDESSALFMLSAVLGTLDDPSAKTVLEESLEIFKSVTKENITPELESVWIERIVSTLSHGFTLEIGEHAASAKEFKRIALALYEQFARVAVTNTGMPTWKQLETQLKQSAYANGL